MGAHFGRSSSVAQRKPLKRTSIKRGKRIRPISEKRQAELEAIRAKQGPLALAWYEATAKKKVCVVCGSTHKVQGHHVIAQQVLRRVARKFSYDVLVLLWDKRNGLAVCRDCHAAHTSAKKRIPRSCIPLPALEFAAELGLTYIIERDYPEAA